MKKTALALSCALSALCSIPAAHALDGLTLQIGESSENTTTYRIGAQFEFGRTLWQSQSGGVQLDGYWDAGVTRWSSLDATSLTFTPMFRLSFGASDAGVTPFLEGGIGASYFTETDLGDQDMGGKFQFEDRLGAGLMFAGGSEVGVRYYHYSNAGIKQPNDGIDMAALYYRLGF
ncbi:lipid A 3-O-deacylase [Halopseudomonas litoralis]|uniref:Lipid A deacylase n=1 Tax=Halopseudomonas litoralis TaxID=797277 RepID=A0A1H1L8I3_9GAMM|nr:acyloxyacyl hydrolase [Halopseudomonas litoralis]SDR70818.1 lipid A 3-O-deacylase [Halopseudomonas litoralis]